MSRQTNGLRAGVLSGLVVMVLGGSVQAQTWEPVDDPDALAKWS